MARNKKNQDSIPQDTPDEIQNAEPQGSDIAGNEPEETSASSPVLPDVIEDVEQAKELVKKKYIVPDGVKIIHVTSDKNVFYDRAASSAHNHAVRNNLQIFSFRWD